MALVAVSVMASESKSGILTTVSEMPLSSTLVDSSSVGSVLDATLILEVGDELLMGMQSGG